MTKGEAKKLVLEYLHGCLNYQLNSYLSEDLSEDENGNPRSDQEIKLLREAMQTLQSEFLRRSK